MLRLLFNSVQQLVSKKTTFAMEQDGPINFKALRAKFQEEAALASAKSNRPTIAEKPRHVPPPGGHCSSVLSGLNHAIENGTTAVPRVIFRSDLGNPGVKRPISFPPQTPPRTRATCLRNVNEIMAPTVVRNSILEGHLRLIHPALPLPPMKDHQPLPASSIKEPKLLTEPPMETLPCTRVKKKCMLLPFKMSKSSKGTTAGGEDSAYATHLTVSRHASVPGEPPPHRGLDDESPRGGECPLSSPDVCVTPPSRDTSRDLDSRIMSTMERAKKKFSRKHMLLYGKGNSLPSPEEDPSFEGKAVATSQVVVAASKALETCEANFLVPSPVCLPHLACISAQYFFEVDNTVHKTALDKQLGGDGNRFPCGRPCVQLQPMPPPIQPLLDVAAVGPPPAKPPRPPCIDLGFYHRAEALPDLSPPPVEEPLPQQSTANTPLLDAPDFTDFDDAVIEAPDDHHPIHFASIDVESLKVMNFDLHQVKGPPPPAEPKTSYIEALLKCEITDHTSFDLPALNFNLNLDSQEDPPPHEPSSLPEPPDLSSLPELPAPESWTGQGLEDSAEPPPVPEHGCAAAGEADPAASESCSSTEETGRAGLTRMVEQPSSHQVDDDNGTCDNVYEDVETINRYRSSQNSLKLKDHKGGPKNPYADSHQVKEEVRLNLWPRNPWGTTSGEHSHTTHSHFHRDRQSPDHNEHKEQKKRERQRQEREKKEQKEKEKRETEMKKKFKVTGLEEPLYHAKVMVATKVRKKNDLAVTSGDTVSIIRTTNCPKGRWLARDASHKFGYISVMNVELNIKEMLELGKKAQAAGRGGNADADTVSLESRSSNYPVLTSSFTDDSEEWACEDETLSPSLESISFHPQAVSVPEMTVCSHDGTLHTLSDANLEDLHTQTRHEALQKLATFFQHEKEDYGEATVNSGGTPTNIAPPSFLCAVEEPPYLEQEMDFTHLELLPPPPLYADPF